MRTDARFNRLLSWFALAGWVFYSACLVLAPRTWWTVLYSSVLMLAMVAATDVERQAG